MTSYIPPTNSQEAPFEDRGDPFKPFLQTSQEDQRINQATDSWQVQSPLVTSGRFAAIKLQPQNNIQTTQNVDGSIYGQPVSPPQAPAQEASPLQAPTQGVSPLFRISFVGADQQWYRINAEVGQDKAVARPQLAFPSSGHLSDAPTSPIINTKTFQPTEISELPHSKVDTSRDFILQYVQPGLAGLMDGSVSTLAPIFSVAFATHNSFTTFLVGMASALGAGISMTFAEALSDDGEQTGRGKPFIRGGVTGLMTFLSGAGHALPFLVSNLQIALIAAYIVVAIELFAIAAIRHKFFGTKWGLSIVQVVGGGALVFVMALLLGNA